MKLKSLIMFSAAALAFAACSNDNEGVSTSNLEGTAVVKVNIETEGTRAVAPTNPVGGDDWTERPVEVNSITLTLIAGTGGGSVTFTKGTEEGQVADPEAAAEKYQFTGVRNPQSMTISINAGAESMTLDQVYNTSLAAPMYATSNVFTENGTAIVEDESLPLYQVNLQPAHKTALLEFSDIKHVDAPNSETACSDCTFETINICGLFLNNVRLSEANQNLGTYASWTAAQAGAPTYSVIADDPDTDNVVENNFKLANGVWPGAGLCYPYNIFPGEPTLVVCFDNITIADGKQVTWNPVNGGYASVSRYKVNLPEDNEHADWVEALDLDDNGYLQSGFKAGYVYRFTDLNIYDEAIGPTVEGGEDVVVEAVITVVPWRLVSGTVEWN